MHTKNLIDELLASPHYGERMASDWLDVARFADSHGYQDDGIRPMWPWRDWVIKAFNDNMSFDQFITWQLAGDLFSQPTKAQKLATGFGRLHMQSQEGGIIEEEFRVEYVADRVKTVGTAFLGLTLECARCHDHKYDPISQKEYYQIFSFFNNINERGQIGYVGHPGPGLLLPDARVDSIRQRIGQQVAAKTGALERLSQEALEDFEQWLLSKPVLRTPVPIAYYPLTELQDSFEFKNQISSKPLALLEGEQRDSIDWQIKDSVRALVLDKTTYINLGTKLAAFDSYDPFSMSLWLWRPADSNDEQAVLSRSTDLLNSCKGYEVAILKDHLNIRFIHSYPGNAIEVQIKRVFPKSSWQQLIISYDGSGKAAGITVFVNGEQVAMDVIHDQLYKSMLPIKATSWGGWEPNLLLGKFREADFAGSAFQHFQIFDKALTAVDAAQLFAKQAASMKLEQASQHVAPPVVRSDSLHYYIQQVHPAGRQLRTELADLQKEQLQAIDTVMEVMVMQELSNPRSTAILDRGAYDSPLEEVLGATPLAVLPFPDSLPRNRLGLSRWLIDPQNPLTARVLVNRFWQQLFGKGLVPTPEDFGNQGSLPSHPELLDWLAYEFIQSGWNVKALLKQMLLSATYRQSSFASDSLRQRDPNNTYYACGAAYRLTAEMLRDQALAASGLLNDEIGGPSVKPYQPAGLWKALATRNATKYVQDTGDKLYRRSLYTFWKRTTPPPSMMTFDAAERNYCTVRRQSTSTPLQSLILLNDPQYIEAARVLAEQSFEKQEGWEARISYVYRALTSCQPNNEQLELLKKQYQAELNYYQAHPELADQLLQTGAKEANEQIEPIAMAALAVVTSTIMNSDASISRR